jgi:hypothetical protein
MNQKSSLREVPQFVSWVLTGNKSISSRMTDSGRFERRQAAPSMNLIANRNVK